MEKFIISDKIFNNSGFYAIHKDGKLIEICQTEIKDDWIPLWISPIENKLKCLTFLKRL
jgi:hypothetical protein